MSLFHADRLLGCAVCAINFITSCSVSEKAALKCFNSTNTAGCFSSLIAPLPWSMLLAMETITVFASGCKHVYFCSKIRHFNMGVYGDLLSFRASLLWPLMELQFLKKKLNFFFLPLTLFLFIFVSFFQKSISPPELHVLLKYNPLSTFLIFLWLKWCIGILYFWSIGFCSFSGENFLKVTIAQVTSVSF